MNFHLNQIAPIILYRNGIVYTEFLGIRIGWDSEANRNYIQNTRVHNPKGIPRFRQTNKQDEFYFQAGSGGIW